MRLIQETLNQTLSHAPEHAFASLASLIDNDWIEPALAASGKASLRRRKLPAEQAIWLVIGLSLYRHLPMWQVVPQLALSLDGQHLPAPSASVQARQRLGSEPLEHLFRQLAQAWSRPSEGSALRVLAVDGGAGRHRIRRRTGRPWEAARPSMAHCLGPKCARCVCSTRTPMNCWMRALAPWARASSRWRPTCTGSIIP